MATETPLDVLLVEDSPTDVLLTEEALSAGQPIPTPKQRTVGRGAAAALEAHFDVVLLDLGLPDSQGIDTLRRLRDKNRKVAVIVLTGKDDEELALRRFRKGRKTTW